MSSVPWCNVIAMVSIQEDAGAGDAEPEEEDETSPNPHHALNLLSMYSSNYY